MPENLAFAVCKAFCSSTELWALVEYAGLHLSVATANLDPHFSFGQQLQLEVDWCLWRQGQPNPAQIPPCQCNSTSVACAESHKGMLHAGVLLELKGHLSPSPAGTVPASAAILFRPTLVKSSLQLIHFG